MSLSQNRSHSPAGSDASHESDNDDEHNSNSKHNTGVKDKECQYCHQKFTSSSLGRHLDQYISKKKPDGVHDVDEIKRLRAGITRRTARGKKGDEQQDSREKSADPSPGLSSNNGPSPAFFESLNKSQPGSNDIKFNRIGWQSTGVITNPTPMPATNSTVVSPLPASSNNLAAGAKRNFTMYAADLPQSTNETTRALELSLREALDAITIATKRTEPLPRPFPFEITAMTFPALCLALLPSPPTLFQSAPFAMGDTISLKPPGFEQREALQDKIRAVLDQWKWDALSHVQRFAAPHNGSANVNLSDEAERLSQTTQKQIQDAMRHLDHAFQYFISHPPEQQYQLWSTELLRAYKTEQDKLKEANERIARVAQEAAQLQQQVEYLSRCQWPREMALWPPERNTFSAAAQKEMQDTNIRCGRFTSLDSVKAYGTPHTHTPITEHFESSSGSNEDRWDFDKLVNKWKRHVREDRARRGGHGNMLPPLISDHDRNATRIGTPPASIRKALSDAHSQNGMTRLGSVSASNSPTLRNGNGVHSYTHPLSSGQIGVTEQPVAFASSNASNITPNNPTGSGSMMGIYTAGRGTLSANSPSTSTRTQTDTPGPGSGPTNHPMSGSVIISDVGDHMARFTPWLIQQRERGRELDGAIQEAEVDVGD